ncbi:MAG: hypothetical protein OEY28_06360 [Nitrospira sp.]|nr:hypothetical protein [Nitrospira sp.]
MTLDWPMLIGLLTLVVVGGMGAYTVRAFVARTRNEFDSHRPALRVTNLSALNAGQVLTLTPEIENVGRGAAHDCVLQLGGWEGNYAVKTIHPRGARQRKHVVPIQLGPDAPIRTTLLSRSYLRLSYRDCWGLIYECWYPVSQTPHARPPLYDLHIDITHPELTEPAPSFRTMRRLLRQTPSVD